MRFSLLTLTSDAWNTIVDRTITLDVNSAKIIPEENVSNMSSTLKYITEGRRFLLFQECSAYDKVKFCNIYERDEIAIATQVQLQISVSENGYFVDY